MVTNKKQTQEDIDRLYEYTGRGFTANGDENFLRSPSGRPSQVSIGGQLIDDPNSEDYKNMKAATELHDKLSDFSQNVKRTPTNGGETVGSTVPQNTQNATQNQNGTSVSNGNTNTRKYDGTDGNGNITVGPQNANLNYYQYGDDSNPNQQGQKGGMNAKYTGEGVSNSYIEYNPDITLADLDPNYLYGENARQQNRKEAGYIARRNDMIASALYNEGKVSKEEVAEFLSQQNEWMNSTEADRLNTIESVWKRLGQIQPKEEPQADFNKDTSGKIYGKTTAEEGNPRQGIDTLSDDNSVFNAINAARVKTTDEMYNVGVDNLAATKYYNTGAYSEQNWRDFSLRYPETAALVEQKVKEMKAQDTVNAVTNGTDLPSNTNTVGAVNNNIADFSNANATSTTSSAQITKNINTMLDNNQTAQTAQELMGTLEGEMATLKNRLKNLREEASSKFKGDVPDYLVNAYMNNKSQEIQNQLSILEDRYNAAYKRYTTEVSQAQWQQEFDLKKKQLDLEEKEFALKKYATEQGIEIDWYKAKGTTSTSNSGRELPVTTKTRDEIGGIVDNLVDMVNNGKAGNAQCATGIQKYYFPELGISIGGLSTFEAKKGLINTDKYYVPKKGDLVIIDSGAKLEDGTNAGHIGIVVSVDGDTLTYLDWNGDGKETAKVRTTSINNKKIAGYYDVTKGQSGSQGYSYTQEDLDMFDDYLHNRLDKDEITILKNKFGVDEAQLTKIANDALGDSMTEPYDIDLSSIEVPDSIYTIEIGENKDGTKITRKVDPNSEEGKKLAQEYIDSKAKELGASTGTTGTKGAGDTQGYNEAYSKTFELIKNNKKKMSDFIDETGLSKKEAQRQYNAWLDKMNSENDPYGYKNTRNVDEELGFVKGKDEVYKWLIAHDFDVPGTTEKQKLLQLGLDPDDENAWNIAIEEAHNYQEYNKRELNPELEDTLMAIEYMIAQGSNQFQRNMAGTRFGFGEADDWDTAYDFIKDKLTLEYFLDLKANGATFGALSNYELSMIANAAKLLDKSDTTHQFKLRLRNLYNRVRVATGRKALTDDEFNKMRNAEDGNNKDMSNFIVLPYLTTSGPLGGNYVRYGSKNYSQGTEGFEKYRPKGVLYDREGGGKKEFSDEELDDMY